MNVDSSNYQFKVRCFEHHRGGEDRICSIGFQQHRARLGDKPVRCTFINRRLQITEDDKLFVVCMVSDYCPWHEVYADNEHLDAVQMDPYKIIKGIGGRPTKSQGRKRKSENAEHSNSSSGSDAEFSSDDDHEDYDASAAATVDIDWSDVPIDALI